MEKSSRHKGVFAALTALHPLVDLISAALFTCAAEDAWEAILYNGVAFVLQLPLGIVLDRCACSLRRLLAQSWLLLVGGCAIYAFTGESVPAIAVACLGNAVFHIAAGRHLLAEDRGRTGRTSMFISTGAIGLLLGMKFGAECPLSTIVAPMAVSAALVGLVWKPAAVHCANERPVEACRGSWLEITALVLLGALVVWRSCGVLTATRAFSSVHSGVSFVFALAFCSWLGQAVSGYAADRYGRFWLLVASLVGSAALCWLCPVDFTVGYLLLMFVAQLATGPVMSYLYRAASSRAGLAFGVNCLALFVSTLVPNCPLGFLWFMAGEWLTLALEYASTAWVKLPHWFWAVMSVNLLTHPALMYVVMRLGASSAVVLTGEVSVVLIEGAVLSVLYRRRWSWWRLFAVSAWMNAVSYFTWELLRSGF